LKLRSKRPGIIYDPEKLPVHIAIIPDGNRRWARQRGLGSIFGHREGAKRIKEIILHASKVGIKHISFYAFSTENWKRTDKEVKGLMELILEFLKKADRELNGSRIRISIVGDKNALPEEIRDEIVRIESKTRAYEGTNLNLFLNYGSRQEILDAMVKAFKDGALELTEEGFRKYLYRPDIPDPDLVIRTSGEYRLSNFMLWQNAYAELYFTDVLWPGFTTREFDKAIADFQKRTRRFGGI